MDLEFWGCVCFLIIVVLLLRRFGFFAYLLTTISRHLLRYASQKIGVSDITPLIQMLTAPSENCVLFENHAVIDYTYQNQTYQLRVPYSRRVHPKYIEVGVFLKKDDQLVNITQQTGFPYLVNAEKLGGSNIILRLNDKEVVLDEKTIPTLTHMDSLFD